MGRSYRSSVFDLAYRRAMGEIAEADLAVLLPVNSKDGVCWFGGVMDRERAVRDRAYAEAQVRHIINANIERAGTLYVIWYGRAFRLDWQSAQNTYTRVEIDRNAVPPYR
jgi:hypothetical protein